MKFVLWVKRNSSYHIEMIFTFFGHSGLDLWPTDPKAWSVIISWPRPIILWSLKRAGWKVLYWFSNFRSRWPWPLTYWPKILQRSSTWWIQKCYEDVWSFKSMFSLKIEKKPTCRNKLTWMDGQKDGQKDRRTVWLLYATLRGHNKKKYRFVIRRWL